MAQTAGRGGAGAHGRVHGAGIRLPAGRAAGPSAVRRKFRRFREVRAAYHGEPPPGLPTPPAVLGGRATLAVHPWAAGG
jgi:hypothetical protein